MFKEIFGLNDGGNLQNQQEAGNNGDRNRQIVHNQIFQRMQTMLNNMNINQNMNPMNMNPMNMNPMNLNPMNMNPMNMNQMNMNPMTMNRMNMNPMNMNQMNMNHIGINMKEI